MKMLPSYGFKCLRIASHSSGIDLREPYGCGLQQYVKRQLKEVLSEQWAAAA